MDPIARISALTPICFGLLGLCLAVAFIVNAVARRRLLNGGLIHLVLSGTWFGLVLWSILAAPIDDQAYRGELVGNLVGAFTFPTLIATWLAARSWRQAS